MSRTGYVIFYANFPIIWCSKLQTEIALFTTESEYIFLLQSFRDVIPLINLLWEMNQVLLFTTDTPIVHCVILKDNKGCIDLVNFPKMSPHTKHTALKYHHFRSFIRDKTIIIQYVETSLQIADIFTKALDDPQFIKLQIMLMRWWASIVAAIWLLNSWLWTFIPHDVILQLAREFRNIQTVVVSKYVRNKRAQIILTYQIILATYELNIWRTTLYFILIYDVMFRLSQ